jgi:hypothetical protein
MNKQCSFCLAIQTATFESPVSAAAICEPCMDAAACHFLEQKHRRSRRKARRGQGGGR